MINLRTTQITWKKVKKQFSTKLVILLMSFTTSLTNFKQALS